MKSKAPIKVVSPIIVLDKAQCVGIYTNEKVEQIKLELNWNQEELEQWAITGKQKE